jgi:D-glycero-D-manno-heptose 1,7-bisphosphate phosphatase
VTVGHLILDRDGVLNVEDEVGWLGSVDAWRWERGAIEGLRLAAANGVAVSVVTNQSGIGRGAVTEADVASVHAWLRDELGHLGVDCVGIFTCPHEPAQGCRCRKPAPGLVTAALEARRGAAADALLVGDAMRDLDAAAAAGVRAILVRTGKGRRTEQDLAAHRGPGAPVVVVDDLAGAVRWALSSAR